MKYKIKQPALYVNTKDISVVSSIISMFKDLQYVYTRISDNNDFVFGPFLKRGVKVITEIDSVDDFYSVLKFHSRNINAQSWAVMVTGKCVRDDLSLACLENLINGPIAYRVGLANPSINDIYLYKTKFDKWPDLISLSICPPNGYPKEVIDCCRLNNISIIALDINNSQIFSKEYLYRLAAKVSDFVCVMADTVEDSVTWSEYLGNLVDRDIDEYTEDVLSIDRDIPFRLALDNMSKIMTFVNIDGDIWRINDPTFKHPKYLMSISDKTDIEDTAKSDIERYVLDNLNEALPEDMSREGEIQFLIKNETEELLKNYFKSTSKLYQIETVPLGSNLFIITVNLKLFRLRSVDRSFILQVEGTSDQEVTIRFKEISEKAN